MEGEKDSDEVRLLKINQRDLKEVFISTRGLLDQSKKDNANLILDQNTLKADYAALQVQLGESELQKNKYKEENIQLSSRITALTAENQEHKTEVQIYKTELEDATSGLIKLKVSKVTLEQQLEVARQRQDVLKDQLSTLKEANERLTDQVQSLEEKNAADDVLHSLELTDLRKDSEAKLEELVGNTKTFWDSQLANIRNLRSLGIGSDTSLYVPLEAPSADKPSTSAAAMVDHVQKRKFNSLVGDFSEGTKRRRETGDNDTEIETNGFNGLTEDDTADADIVVKIEGCEIEPDNDWIPPEDIESQSQSEGVDLCTKLFGNDKIMANIVKYLPTMERPQLRLTCRTWNTTVSKALRDSHLELKFSPVEQNLEAVADGSTLNDFVETMSRSRDGDIPFGKFHILNLSFSGAVANLIQTCGKVITVLKITLEDHNVFTLNDLRNLIFNQTPALQDLKWLDKRPKRRSCSECWTEEVTSVEEHLNCPQLRRLELELVCHSICRDRFVRFVAEILKASKNLEHVDIYEDYYMSGQDLNFGALRAIEEEANLKTLKSMNMYYMSEEDWKLLIRLSSRKENRLQLNSFVTSFDECPTSTIYDMHPFLKCQSDCLQKLTVRLNFEENGSVVSIELPKLNILEQLFVDVQNPQQDQNIRFVSLMETFPNLHIFEFTHGKRMSQKVWNNYFPETHSGVLHEGVRVLKVTIDNFFFVKKLTQLFKLFPNVRELNLRLGYVDPLRHIWDKWALLEKLHLEFHHVDATETEMKKFGVFLTGISSKHHRLLNLKSAPTLNLNKKKNNLGITDLQNLRELTLDFTKSPLAQAEAPSIFIPEIAVNCGLALLRHLHTLNIIPARLISPSCQAVLKKALDSNALRRLQE